MTRALMCGVLLAGVMTCAIMPASAAQGRHGSPDGPFLREYCTGCHNTDQWSGGLALDLFDPQRVGEDAEVWENVVRKVRTGMMPPAGEPRPPEARLADFAASLEDKLDRAARSQPHVGSPGLRRMTRFEYGNVIRDVLGLELDAAKLLPPDNSSDGFDTNGDTLMNSPALVEAYVNAAAKLARRAVGDRQVAPMQVDHRAPVGWSQQRHIEGMPLGTRGGIAVDHEFALDAEYELSIATASGTLFGDSLPRGTRLYVAIDGKPLQPLADNARKFRARIAAGPHRLVATMVDQVRSSGTDDVYSIGRLQGGVVGISVSGPYAAQGVGDTPSRRKVFICRPAQPDDEAQCAARILANLATLAYRQPLQAGDAAVQSLLAHYRAAREHGDFESGIEQALARMLANPRFLFRLEREPAGARPGTAYRITGLELASRLALFLWSSVPDVELLQVAARGRLHEAKTLEQQVRRMLQDPRASALATNFAGQWLHMRALGSVPVADPGFTENLRQSMQRETHMLVADIIDADRSIMRLIDADYSFLDVSLARHYGIEGVKGGYMRRVELTGRTERHGLLGQGSVLTLTSLPDRTSPVVRGKWILENVLGAHVPAPPAGVETNLDPPIGAEQPMTLRQRLEAHRSQEDCAACHRIIDPIGFALENFDRTGQWRTDENGLTVDTRGELTDGTPLDGPDSLRSWLAAHPDVFATNVARKLLIYALGRSIDHRDMPLVRSIVRDAAGDDYRFSTLVMGIVRSRPFQFREAGPAPAAAASNTSASRSTP